MAWFNKGYMMRRNPRRNIKILDALIRNDFSVTNAALDLSMPKTNVSSALYQMEKDFVDGFFITSERYSRNGGRFKGISDPENVEVILKLASGFNEAEEILYG